MTTPAIRRTWSIIVALLLVIGFFTHAQAEPSYGASQLNESLTLLAQGRSIYKGHRSKAMHHVFGAIREVHGRYIRTGKVKAAKTDSESDARLRAAQNVLSQCKANLSGKARTHVDQALQEITLCLSVR